MTFPAPVQAAIDRASTAVSSYIEPDWISSGSDVLEQALAEVAVVALRMRPIWQVTGGDQIRLPASLPKVGPLAQVAEGRVVTVENVSSSPVDPRVTVNVTVDYRRGPAIRTFMVPDTTLVEVL